MKDRNLLDTYIEFCKNSKIHTTSKFTVDPWGDTDRPRVMAMDTFSFPDTAIRRVRRFLRSLELSFDYATIPLKYPEWENSFSYYDDVKYTNEMIADKPSQDCSFYINEEQVAMISDFGDQCVMMIDLTRLTKALNDKHE